jgi:hypothetical protein
MRIRTRTDQCQIGKMSKYACPRIAKTVRKTSKGTLVRLCKKCDARYGESVGPLKEHSQ